MHASPSWFAGPHGRIAFRYQPGRGPMLVFLPGYRSDMTGTKASAFHAQAEAQGRACLLLEYSGCGQSEGDFADGTLTRWRGDVLALIDHVGPGERLLLVGSSMGGWLMLLVAMAVRERVAGLLGIAAAPDFTDWGYRDDQKEALGAGNMVLEENPYGPEATPTYPGLWADGQAQLLLASEIALSCPVHLIQGQRDDVVPWQTALRLGDSLAGDSVRITLVKDGDHNLSRDVDIALLLQAASALAASR